MEGKNGVKQKPYMHGREKRHETKPFGRKRWKEKKNIGLCYSKLLTQFTMIYLFSSYTSPFRTTHSLQRARTKLETTFTKTQLFFLLLHVSTLVDACLHGSVTFRRSVRISGVHASFGSKCLFCDILT